MTNVECLNEQWVAENPGESMSTARGMWWCDCPKCIAAPMSLGERLDIICARMDAAYDERRKYRIGTPEYDAANVLVEAVYTDLRALNAEARA